MAEVVSRQRKAALSRKQRKFIDEYVANNGNGTAAARAAGYSDSSDNVLAQQARQNLSNPKIFGAIELQGLQITPERVQERLAVLSLDAQASGQFGPAVRAEELLGKSIGMWIDRSLQLTGVLNDSHVAALLEIARRRQQEPIELADDSPHTQSTRDASDTDD